MEEVRLDEGAHRRISTAGGEDCDVCSSTSVSEKTYMLSVFGQDQSVSCGGFYVFHYSRDYQSLDH